MPGGKPKHFCTLANQISAFMYFRFRPAMLEVASTAKSWSLHLLNRFRIVLALICVPLEVSFWVMQITSASSGISKLATSICSSNGNSWACDSGHSFCAYSNHFLPKAPLCKWKLCENVKLCAIISQHSVAEEVKKM